MKYIILIISVAALLTTSGCIFAGHEGHGEHRGHGEYHEHEVHAVVVQPAVVVRVHGD